MLKIGLIGVESIKKDLEKSLSDTIKKVADEVFVSARANTPIKTGNARSKWTKKVQSENFQVENRVPYIQRLEAGASKQAPKGIIGPTLSQVKGKT